jgi:hypothetical protein
MEKTMKTAEEIYREKVREFNSYLQQADLPFDDTREREFVIEGMKEYGNQTCQVTFEKILDEIKPFLVGVPEKKRIGILKAFIETNPITP